MLFAYGCGGCVGLRGAPVDTKFHLVGGITHLLFGREDDFRGFQRVLYRDFRSRVHHFGGDDETERTELGEVNAHAQLQGVTYYVGKADKGVLHIALRQRGLAHDTLDEHLVREILLALGLGVIHRLPEQSAHRCGRAP